MWIRWRFFSTVGCDCIRDLSFSKRDSMRRFPPPEQIYYKRSLEAICTSCFTIKSETYQISNLVWSEPIYSSKRLTGEQTGCQLLQTQTQSRLETTGSFEAFGSAARLSTVGGNCNTKRKPTRTQAEHENTRKQHGHFSYYRSTNPTQLIYIDLWTRPQLLWSRNSKMKTLLLHTSSGSAVT